MTDGDSVSSREKKKAGNKGLGRKIAPKRSRKAIAPLRPADSPLTPQEELFVELYFHYDFDARKAFERAGYAAKPSSLRSNAYRLRNQPWIQAAIMRRRAALAEKRTLTREEKVAILEDIARSPRNEPRDRILAIRMHSQMVGDMPAGDPSRAADRLTAAALKSLTMAELIEQANRGAMVRVLPSPIIDIQATPTNGKTKTNGHQH